MLYLYIEFHPNLHKNDVGIGLTDVYFYKQRSQHREMDRMTHIAANSSGHAKDN